MEKSEIKQILELHGEWLREEWEGKRADFSGADLQNADFSGVDLRWAIFKGADLKFANFRGSDLSNTSFYEADLKNADFSRTELKRAVLTRAVLEDTKLERANLSGAIGLLSPIDYLERNFEKTEKGFIAYKTFNSYYKAPLNWLIKPGSVICENVDFDRCNPCGCGINVGTYDYVERRHPTIASREKRRLYIWAVLIRFEWLTGVCVPYNTEGQIRCERVELLGEVD